MGREEHFKKLGKWNNVHCLNPEQPLVNMGAVTRLVRYVVMRFTG